MQEGWVYKMYDVSGHRSGGAVDVEESSTYRVRPFRPAWWLRGAHAQTFGGKFLRPDPRLRLRRKRLETPDGDFVDLDFTPPPREGAPVVLVLHGLEGSALRRYMLVTYRELLDQGLHPIGLNFRSCSGEPNRALRFYHSGDTEDVRFVLELLAERYPGVPMGAVGFSLGGNVLLKYLGEEGERGAERLRCAVTISVPFDLAAGAERLEQGIPGRIYTGYFLQSLRRKVTARADELRGHCDVEAALRARTLREFDDAVTAPLNGFADALDYYRRSSSAAYLERIRVPTLLLQSEDDPFLPREAIPWDAIRGNPHLINGFTERGGHVGFVSGKPWAPRFWAEEETARFIGTALSSEK